ncbi:DEAD/DEAH box helicase [Methanosarcina sp. KYL-1]|uniref:DEAD/DEAH box helicase n=1 Tax=Methanosarcina sp. KYL-1 TaxID=2602068 RepID=UPI002100B7A2|nr:DEAD/DEAH box helicase [Methanosarcina sp. KYL-1]MCQ1536808.1 DEAD/DEAH box helicase [Methanosarcina sp. KYL-1]
MTISGEAALGMETVELEPLREDKQKIFKDILAYLETHQRGYIKVPTGWGKTFLSKHIMQKYYTEGKLVLFLVSKNNPLLNQTYYDRKKESPLFPNSAVLSSEHKTDRKELAKVLKKHGEGKGKGFVLFASLQTVLGKQSEDIKKLLLEYTDLAVVDEIHNFINNRGNDFLNEFGGRTSILGMTATPFQGVVGNVKFVDEIAGDMREVYAKTLPECILDEELAPLKYVIAESSEDIFEIFDFDKGLAELDRQDLFLDCSTAEKMKKVVRRTQLAKDVYDSRIKGRKAKTLVFCAPVRKQVYGAGTGQEINAFHAKLAASVFNGEISAAEFEKDRDPVLPSTFDNYAEDGSFRDTAFITSELPKDEQKALLEAFKDTTTPPYVLCTVGMLIEGFDFPALESLILLRPTLSMRLFEQQIGRVTRLSPVSGKRKGSVFEIADNIDSLYQRFGDGVFGGEKVDQIQMLQPEIRLEELFSEGDAARAIEEGKIEISKIDFRPRGKGDSRGKGKGTGEGKEMQAREVPVRLPPTALRARYFSRLLALTEEKDIGAFEREKRELMRAALRFRVRDPSDSEELFELCTQINKLKREAYEDRRLGDVSRQHKPKVFGEVEWLLKLQALNSLKYACDHLSYNEKARVLRTLGFEPDFRRIDSQRLKCLKIGSAQKTIPDLVKVLGFVSRLSSSETYQFLDKKKKEQWKREFLPAVYWGFCFIEDSPELKELFESTEWDRRVKNIIRQK